VGSLAAWQLGSSAQHTGRDSLYITLTLATDSASCPSTTLLAAAAVAAASDDLPPFASTASPAAVPGNTGAGRPPGCRADNGVLFVYNKTREDWIAGTEQRQGKTWKETVGVAEVVAAVVVLCVNVERMCERDQP
jgi:hypothetical protein